VRLTCFPFSYRAGYAGESVPLCIVPSQHDGVWLRDVDQEAPLRYALRSFLRNIYLK